MIEELQKDGFIPIKYESEWACFGWPSLICKESWEGQRGRTLDKLFEEIPEELKIRINSQQCSDL